MKRYEMTITISFDSEHDLIGFFVNQIAEALVGNKFADVFEPIIKNLYVTDANIEVEPPSASRHLKYETPKVTLLKFGDEGPMIASGGYRDDPKIREEIKYSESGPTFVKVPRLSTFSNSPDDVLLKGNYPCPSCGHYGTIIQLYDGAIVCNYEKCPKPGSFDALLSIGPSIFNYIRAINAHKDHEKNCSVCRTEIYSCPEGEAINKIVIRTRIEMLQECEKEGL